MYNMFNQIPQPLPKKGVTVLKLWQKIAFILVLIVFVSVSVTISLISISRAPYKFTEETAVGGNEALNGWVFERFNGNAATKTLSVDYVRDRNGNAPDETRPVVAVGAYCVNADEYVEEIVIGKSVQHIDETAFFNMKRLQRVSVDPENPAYADRDGVLYSKDGKLLLLYPACYRQTSDSAGNVTYPNSYAVPEGVERIATFAFLKNEHLRDLSLPESLRQIGDMAFFGCGRLGAFDYEPSLDILDGTGLSLPDGLEQIGSDAFSKCGNLAPGIYIPASVKEIRHHAFFSCGGLKQILLGAPDADSVSLGEAWLPKNLKAGPLFRAPEPQFGKTRTDYEALLESHRADRLNAFREEAANNG